MDDIWLPKRFSKQEKFTERRRVWNGSEKHHLFLFKFLKSTIPTVTVFVLNTRHVLDSLFSNRFIEHVDKL